MTVELSTTCWERTYRDVLSPGYVDAIAKANGDPFDERAIVINNVFDQHDAIERAEQLMSAGEISRYLLVGAELPRALALTGLTQRQLGLIPHYTDHLLVAVAATGPAYLCHWDSDVRLVEPHDWVRPSLAYLERHPQALTAMPAWNDHESLEAERLETDGPFDLGYGFTDHVFLLQRERLVHPVYRFIAPASWWYATSHLTPIFEQRVDAYMRRCRLYRATYRPATYIHDGKMLWQPGGGWRRAERKARTITRAALERWAPRHPALVKIPDRL